jgi:hypothetical protein
MKFLPIKPTSSTTTIDQINIKSGFLVSQSPGREHLTFAFQDSNGKVQISSANGGNGGGSFSLAGADPNYPLYQYDVIASTTTANIIVFRLDAASSGNSNSFQYFAAPLPNGQFSSVLGPQNMSTIFGTTVPVLAAQVFPQTTATDTFSFLVSNAGSYQEGTTTFGGVSGFATSTPSSSVLLPGAGNRLLYYKASGVSYASYYAGGKWVCYQWTPTLLPALLTNVTHRIDALLTNGDLISTEGGTLRVYDPGGGQVLSVGLSGLQFCYEAYVGTTPYMFFSLSLDFPHNSWAFRVYAIPTSELRGLKG